MDEYFPKVSELLQKVSHLEENKLTDYQILNIRLTVYFPTLHEIILYALNNQGTDRYPLFVSQKELNLTENEIENLKLIPMYKLQKIMTGDTLNYIDRSLRIEYKDNGFYIVW